MPKVSVIIPSYNHGHYIQQAVRSVLDQSYRDLELIVIDDGSRDDSLARLAATTDERLRVIAQENRGAHAALNRGLAESQGEYLAILNSDDLYTPERLAKMVPCLEDDPSIGLLSSYIQVVDREGKSLGVKEGYANLHPWLLANVDQSFRGGTDIRAALLTENYLATTSNFLFRRRWYERAGDFRPLRYTHDWDFALRMARIATIQLLPEPLLHYRIHGKNTIHEDRAAMIFEICWCLAVHLPNHCADTQWYGEVVREQRVSQLLHSIYTYGNEQVLAVMLLEKLHEDTESALALLATNNPRRQVYLNTIRQQMTKSSAAAEAANGYLPAWLLSGLRRFSALSFLKQ